MSIGTFVVKFSTSGVISSVDFDNLILIRAIEIVGSNMVIVNDFDAVRRYMTMRLLQEFPL